MVIFKKQSQASPPLPSSFAHGVQRFFAPALVLSLLVHLAAFIGLSLLPRLSTPKKVKDNTSIVTFKPITRPKPDLSAPAPADQAQKILETPLAKTEAPEVATHLGAQNHRAEREQKLAKDKQSFTKNRDPGKAGGQANSRPLAKQAQIASHPAVTSLHPKTKVQQKSRFGPARAVPKARNRYEQLLQDGQSILQQTMAQGFQDFIDGKYAEGDFIDLNTHEYRYIGYFTSMRKAIELAWSYPASAAANGIYGKVGIGFTILKDGRVDRVEVLNSSGYDVLDLAIVDAIKEAAPFAPLPDGFGKENMNISGTFSYVLH